ncbi:hypothetical protein C1I95_24625 [Micromonospora craterilacus]|uniref:Uncharacterized protein n=1 Tax=Micromonospora craterilacus TaxID=1655439 RepID=A0A2W2DM17_9ACTN|nr:hypothetical protein [Micromonospora craterilacus]PZG12996.1 hypothetical protein C1I95_24625 [Micromonospora craterilacus]
MTTTIETQQARDLIARVKAAHGTAGGSVDLFSLALIAEQAIDTIGLARDALRRAGYPPDGDDLAAVIYQYNADTRDAIRTLGRVTAQLRAEGSELGIADLTEEWAAVTHHPDGKSTRRWADDAEHAALIADSVATHVASLSGPTSRANGIVATSIEYRTRIKYDNGAELLNPWHKLRDGQVRKD